MKLYDQLFWLFLSLFLLVIGLWAWHASQPVRLPPLQEQQQASGPKYMNVIERIESPCGGMVDRERRVIAPQ